MNKDFYAIPDKFIKLVANKEEKGLLLYGKSSLGKTYRVLKVLSDMGKKEKEDYHFITGHITPLQFFCELSKAKDKLVILDDVNILESKINLNMLKAALNENGGKVEYLTTKTLPENRANNFIFTGQVIILLNEKPKRDEHLRAVENRLLSYQLKFSYEQIIDVLTDIAQNDILNIHQGLSKEERLEILEWIKLNTTLATKNLNIRLYQHIINFYKSDKTSWKTLASSILDINKYISLIIQGTKEDEWITKTGLSRRSFYRYQAIYGKSAKSAMVALNGTGFGTGNSDDKTSKVPKCHDI